MHKTVSAQLPDEYEYEEKGRVYRLRQVRYPDDMPLLHKWMNTEHVIPQWQLNKSLVDLSVYYEKMLSDDHHRLYLVGIDGEWLGYTEIYEGKRDRLGRYYDGDPDDLGWHLLFGELSAFGKGYLRAVIRMLSYFIFENSNAKKIVGEPDHTVKPYEMVVKDLCYEAQRLIPMPEKTAMLYYCHKETFLAKFPKQTSAAHSG
jgi:acetyl CoA:N6-hydroxylysine acetyl transferase